MKLSVLSQAAFAAVALALPALAGAAIVNFDVNGASNAPGPGADDFGPTFVGVGAAGGGTTFNSIVADSRDGNFAKTFSGAGSFDSNGNAVSGFSFSTGLAGGDNNGAGTAATAAVALLQDYLFVSANGTGTATFTLDVPDDTTSADIFFYTQTDGGIIRFPIITVAGGSFAGFESNGDVPASSSARFSVPEVTGGVITGTFQAFEGGESISGLSVNTVIPEPAALSLLGLGGLALLGRRRRA